MSAARIAIIGAGMSGMTSAKACLEERFSIVVYEQTNFTGGLWRYHEDDVNGIASVAKSTIINSSKEMSAFSDFPPPHEFPNYMHNTKMVKYFDMYGESFNFANYVKFRHEIIKLEPNFDYEDTGKWQLTIKDLANDKIFTEVFDGVMVCTGHHITPLVPTFTDQHKFKGQILHTHSYKKPNGFEDKDVIVVGIGNSGGDAAVELSMVARKCYLSTRRGTWIMHRVGQNGDPFDGQIIRRFWNLFFITLPYWLICTFIETYISLRFNHKHYQLKPKHRILSQHVMVNDALPNRILSGTVVVKGDIESFTENGVIFSGDTEETPCDIILLATGYRISFPFISQKLLDTDNNRVHLYKYMFMPTMKHPNTLAFIAVAQTQGPLTPLAEMHARYFALLMSNKLKLPSERVMLTDIDRKMRAQAKRYYAGEKHTVQVDWIPTMDELGEVIGVKPNLVKYFFTDPELWRSLMFGPCVPYQYRLNGPHSWSGARKAILTINERIKAPLKTKVSTNKKLNSDHSKFSWTKFVISFISIFSFIVAFFVCVLFFV